MKAMVPVIVAQNPETIADDDDAADKQRLSYTYLYADEYECGFCKDGGDTYADI